MKGIEIIELSNKIKNIYEHRYIDLCKEYSINQTSLDIILFLSNNKQYNTAKDICEVRGIKSGIASVCVEKLIQKEYLKRVNDSNDRRINRIYLTTNSKELVKKASKIQKEFFNELFENISKEQVELFYNFVDVLENKVREMK
ncbi:MAG: MarR family winged helix-turn-helix transcriptional regulator [Thomasclavelia sp.]|nr:MarR family winged helix-turn-helix transcriptional regulator [Thomasclavelia sp.]